MNRRRITLGAFALLLVAIAARPSHSSLTFDIDLADAKADVAKAESMVKVGIGGATVLVTWTRAALR
ncbi:hypothetical protein [Sphingomonas sp.]|uniref:hypothetical protein n=1 Tax=Sphingomonas sp. TaxID=28214 RepID=UPI0035C84A94